MIDLTHIRKVRLYHWKLALEAGLNMRRQHLRTPTRERYRSEYNLHMGFVQALNDLFPLGDTAEKDANSGSV